MNILKSKKGMGYIDYVIGIFCIMLVISFSINFLNVFSVKQKLDLFATEIVREAEILGSTSVQNRIETMNIQTGLDPEIEWECNYFSGTKVQLNDDIKATLYHSVDVGLFNVGSISIELTAVATGKSEVYCK